MLTFAALVAISRICTSLLAKLKLECTEFTAFRVSSPGIMQYIELYIPSPTPKTRIFPSDEKNFEAVPFKKLSHTKNLFVVVATKSLSNYQA